MGVWLQDVFLIGGVPSSGSTLLVHLLNRDEHLMCLPETGLFAHGRNLVDLSADLTRDDLGWHIPWLQTGKRVAGALGWDPNDYDRARSHYPTAFELLRAHIDPDRKFYLVERTPENIFAFHRFLAQAREHRVVVTSRNSLSVVQSLMRRGLTLLESLLVWFAYSYETARLLAEFPSQIYHCCYERLTQQPDQVAAEVISFFGIARPTPAQSTDWPLNAANAEKDGASTLLNVSSWNLEATTWLHSPTGQVQYERPINLIGLEFEMLTDLIAFNTPDRGLVRSIAIDKFLAGDNNQIATEDRALCEPANLKLNCLCARMLADRYPPYMLRR